jgi:type II secretory pathway predicted ATPase ExeA
MQKHFLKMKKEKFNEKKKQKQNPQQRKKIIMIKSYFGIKQTPFDQNHLTLTRQQKEILDIINIHSKQGGLSVIAGKPGSGKTVIVKTLQEQGKGKNIEVPVVSRTMHSYQNVIKIMQDAFSLDNGHLIKDCEMALIKEAISLHSQGKTLITIIDDAHLLKPDVLRKLRLLFDAFPRNHNLVLIGQTELLPILAMSGNADIKSRITYSVKVSKLPHDEIERIILAELDKSGLAHTTFEQNALELLTRNADGSLRACRNLVLGCLAEATRLVKKNVSTDIVNSILIQPHWRSHDELLQQS